MASRLRSERLSVQHDREQQGREHRTGEGDPGRGLFELEKLHIEGGVVGDQNGRADEGLEQRQHLARIRLAAHHLPGDAVDADRGLRNAPPNRPPFPAASSQSAAASTKAANNPRPAQTIANRALSRMGTPTSGRFRYRTPRPECCAAWLDSSFRGQGRVP